MIDDEINIPNDRLYTVDHEWALVEDSDRVRIGITDHAQRSLHEIVFVDVPKVGQIINRMDAIGTTESVKAVSEVYSPVSGSVIAVNEELEMSPELVNQDPYGKGWIIIIEPSNLEAELPKLLTPKQYTEHLRKK